MSSDWPHIPADLHVGDVIVIRASQCYGERTAIRIQQAAGVGGWYVTFKGRRVPLFINDAEELRIVRRS